MAQRSSLDPYPLKGAVWFPKDGYPASGCSLPVAASALAQSGGLGVLRWLLIGENGFSLEEEREKFVISALETGAGTCLCAEESDQVKEEVRGKGRDTRLSVPP